MKKLVVIIALFIMPLISSAAEFGITGGLGSGSLSSTGVSSSEAKFNTGLAWNLGVTLDFEGNGNYLKLGVLNQMAEMEVYSGSQTVKADFNIWYYELTGNYYFFNIADAVNVYGTLSAGLANMEVPNGGTTDMKYFLGVGANFRYKATDKVYISAAVEYKKVLDDYALLIPSLNLEFKF